MKKLAFFIALFSSTVFADNPTTGVYVRPFIHKISVDYIICELPYENCTSTQNIILGNNSEKRIDAPKDYIVSIGKVCDLKNNDCHSWYFYNCSVKARHNWGAGIWFTLEKNRYWTCNIAP